VEISQPFAHTFSSGFLLLSTPRPWYMLLPQRKKARLLTLTRSLVGGEQGFGSVFIFSGSGSGSRVWGWIPIRIRIQSGSRALMTKNWQKITAEKKLNFFYQKLQFTYPQASIKYVQVTEEAFSSQKRPSNTTKHELLQFFLLLWVIFALLDPDPDPLARLNTDSIRIRNPAQERDGGGVICTAIESWRASRYWLFWWLLSRELLSFPAAGL
jgi:hypothetical protein